MADLLIQLRPGGAGAIARASHQACGDLVGSFLFCCGKCIWEAAIAVCHEAGGFEKRLLPARCRPLQTLPLQVCLDCTGDTLWIQRQSFLYDRAPGRWSGPSLTQGVESSLHWQTECLD